jgi:regulator of RNase E activity RraA
VLVIEAPDAVSSVLGGKAAQAAVSAGVAAVVVDGAVRDLDEIDATGLCVWSRGSTPITGRNRLEAVEINGPVQIGAVGVEAGDVVVADRSGIVFVPAEVFGTAAGRILGTLGRPPEGSTLERP